MLLYIESRNSLPGSLNLDMPACSQLRFYFPCFARLTTPTPFRLPLLQSSPVYKRSTLFDSDVNSKTFFNPHHSSSSLFSSHHEGKQRKILIRLKSYFQRFWIPNSNMSILLVEAGFYLRCANCCDCCFYLLCSDWGSSGNCKSF